MVKKIEMHDYKPMEFTSLGDFWVHLKNTTNPSYMERAILVFSIMDWFEADKIKGDKIYAVIKTLADELNLSYEDLTEILTGLCKDVNFFTKVHNEFKRLFEHKKPEFVI